MPLPLYLGLFLALVGAPLLGAATKMCGVNPLSLVPRLMLWVAAFSVIGLAALGTEAWRSDLGVGSPTWQAALLALVASAFVLVAMGGAQFVQRRLGQHPAGQLAQLQSIFALPLHHRIFLAVTAAVVEEVLYRGYAIGVGQHLLGGLGWSSVVSIAAFSIAHLRWGLAHLLPVLISAIAISLLFIHTQNLWACIVAHAIVDVVGFVVVPAAMAMRQRRSTEGPKTSGPSEDSMS